MTSFFFFMIDETTPHTRYPSYKNARAIWWSDGTMEMKSKSHFRIILLIKYMMEENMFVYVECCSVKHVASRFYVRKNVTKKRKEKKEVTPGWTDISCPGPVSFLSRSSMYYIMVTLHNPIKPLNIVSTNSFPWGPNFASTTACVQTTWDGCNLP